MKMDAVPMQAYLTAHLIYIQGKAQLTTSNRLRQIRCAVLKRRWLREILSAMRLRPRLKPVGLKNLFALAIKGISGAFQISNKIHLLQ